MKQRQQQRRQGQALFYEAIADRRRPAYDRRGQTASTPSPGAVRPGFAEAPPPAERRRVPEGGME